MDDIERYRPQATRAMTQISRNLRHQTTTAEEMLWQYLRDRNFERIKFRRQHALAATKYVADFYCYESQLVIELDGAIHNLADQQAADVDRQLDIEALGYQVLRFRNEQVFEDIATVLTTILAAHTERCAMLKSISDQDAKTF